MTGFGTAEGPLGGGRITVEARTVNHRHFNSQFRLPPVLQRYESEMRARLRERIARGHVALAARWTLEPPRASGVRVDVERARAIRDALVALKDALGLSGDVDLGLVARQPDVIIPDQEVALELSLDELLEIVDRALDGVIEMRAREGEALGRDLMAQLEAIEDQLTLVERRAPERLFEQRDRLRAAVSELLAGHTLDEGRLAAELALFAERLDVGEEIVRLRAHIDQARAALSESGAVGRRLAFLGQEMLREVNTIGSKGNDAEIARAVVAMKESLERFREQVENVE